MIYIGVMKIESIFLLIVMCSCQVACTSQSDSDQNHDGISEKSQQFVILTEADVLTGAERLDTYFPLIENKKIGLVVNQTSVVDKTHLVDTLLALNVDIKNIFAPEHGFRGEADAGSHIEDGVDEKTGIHLTSLYGSTRKPEAEIMKELDYLIFDIQDVGVRFYTFLSTLSYVMEACSEHGVKLIVLDRPNPNGFYVDGPVLQSEFSSFVGLHPVPIVHGMTFGELSKMILAEEWAACSDLDLTVVSCLHYNHESTYQLPIKPSPNLPNLQSILLYPSLCLFEPTEYSIGRGTTFQFQVLGRPDAPAGDFYFSPQPMPGAMTPKHENIRCRGIDLRTYDIKTIYKNRTLDLSFLLEYLSGDGIDYVTKTSFFDKLAGNSTLRQSLKEGKSEKEIRQEWEPELSRFKELRNKYLLYN